MEFFNKKEEVIDLQLTQYGKELLAMGKLKPVYYAFYDVDILYDTEYASVSELQNSTESRIQENTPNLKTQYVFHGIDEYVAETTMANPYGKEISELLAQLDQINEVRESAAKNADKANTLKAEEQIKSLEHYIAELQAAEVAVSVFTGETTSTAERTQALYNPLGDSDLGSNKAPSWNIALISGESLTGSTSQFLTLSGSNTILDIPQIEAQITYNVSVAEVEDSNLSLITDDVMLGEIDGISQDILESQLAIQNGDSINDSSLNNKIFSDNTFLKISADDLILQVVEDNVPLTNENFEIEIFEIEDANTNGKVAGANNIMKLNPLRFLKDPELVVNDILMDPEEIDDGTVPSLNTTMVDYYFDIEADDEINAALLCSKIKNADKRIYKYASKDFNCDDIITSHQFLDPYAQKSIEDECE